MKKALLASIFCGLAMSAMAAYQYETKGNQGWLTFDSETTVAFDLGRSGKDKDHVNFIDRGEGVADYGWYNLETGESGSFNNGLSATFSADDRIGLYVTDYVNETTPMPLQISGNRANNSLVTFDGSVWAPEQTIYWSNGKSDVYAYYPYFETISDINKLYFEVATDQTGEGYADSDFLWAKAEGVRQTDGTVNLEMKHLMSKLTVKIVAGEDYIGSLPEDATVHLHSTVTNVNIDLENGSVVKDPYSGAESIKMKNLCIRTFDGEKAVVYEAIVVPQMIENSVPLLEINSKSVSYLLEDPFNFRPGVEYTYTATLNTSTTAIKVEIGCELEDWNSAGGSGSGEGGESGEGEDDGKTYPMPAPVIDTVLDDRDAGVICLGGEKLLALHAVRRDTDRPGIYGYVVDFSDKTWNKALLPISSVRRLW